MPRKYLLAYNGLGAGLGNRVRVVLGAQILAEREDRRLLYVWPTGRAFGPTFTQLFDFEGGRPVSRVTSKVLARRYPYRDATLGWLDDGTRRERLWQIKTGGALELPDGSETWGDRLRGLRPVADVAARIKRLYGAELAGEPYVGVMIRAHEVSHPETKRASPVDWFVDRMKAIREERPGVRFFVCCDVPEVQERVMATIGGCVGQRDKGGYNTVEGVKSSLVDLYLLASSQRLVAPHFSSFIHMAQHLGGDAVPIETSRTDGLEGSGRDELVPVVDPLRPWSRAQPGERSATEQLHRP